MPKDLYKVTVAGSEEEYVTLHFFLYSGSLAEAVACVARTFSRYLVQEAHLLPNSYFLTPTFWVRTT